MAKQNYQSPKSITASVTLNVPPPVPNYEFLQQRINTKMTFCGDVEKMVNGRAIMAQGHLTLLLDVSVRHIAEAFLHRNVCVEGPLTQAGKGFQMVIADTQQIWLTGH